MQWSVAKTWMHLILDGKTAVKMVPQYEGEGCRWELLAGAVRQNKN